MFVCKYYSIEKFKIDGVRASTYSRVRIRTYLENVEFTTGYTGNFWVTLLYQNNQKDIRKKNQALKLLKYHF